MGWGTQGHWRALRRLPGRRARAVHRACACASGLGRPSAGAIRNVTGSERALRHARLPGEIQCGVPTADSRSMSLHAWPRTVALIPFLVAGCGAASAGTHWRCELTSDLVRLACRVLATTTDAPSAEAATTITAVVNGTRFPLDADRRWFVDLWTPPSDPQWQQLLARATICYRSAGCTVEVVDPAMTTAAR